MRPTLQDLPADASPDDIKDFFLNECFRQRNLTLYTDWIAKLLEAGQPVEDWIHSCFPEVDSIFVKYLRDDTQNLIRRIQWPLWNDELDATETRDGMQLLDNVRYVQIERFAIKDLPPWLFHMRHLHELVIQQEQLDVKKKIVEYYNNSPPPLVISAQLGTLQTLQRLDISNTGKEIFPYQFESDFCRQTHLTLLALNLTQLQSPLDDLGLFSRIEHAIFISNESLPSYNFLCSLSTLKTLYLHTKMGQFPEEIRSLQNLNELKIPENNLTDLPEWIVDLPRLQSLVIDYPPIREKSGDIVPNDFTGPSPLSVYPPALRKCSSLLHCTLGVPARSLANLPSLARYWAALAFNSQANYPTNTIAFDLPEIVRDRVNAELPGVGLDYELVYIDALITSSFQPSKRPADHPSLVAWLDVLYAKPYDTLFDQVRNGKPLTELEQIRFIHETSYQYYQLICNNTLLPSNSPLLDALTRKFSVQINSTNHILL